MKRFAIAALMGAVFVANSGPAASETFTEVLGAALENSPEVLTQRQVLRGLDEAVAVARGGMRPTISATASIGVTAVDDGRTGEAETFPTSVGVTATQPLFDGFQTDNNVAAADANVEAGRFTLMATELDLLLAAAEVYVGVIQAQENVRLARNNVAVIARQLEATRARLEVGEVTRTDVAQAEARLAESRANLRAREGDLRAAIEEFERVVGFTPTSLEPLPPLPALPTSLEAAEEIALQRNPEYLATFAIEEAAAFGVDAARGALLPQVSLSSSLSMDSQRVYSDETTVVTGAAAVTVTVPIYTGGTLRSTVRSSAALEEQRARERDTARRALLRDVGVNWEALLTARATIVANAEQVEAQRVAFNGVQEEARVGSRTTLDVLDAEQDLLDARVALVNSQSDEQIAAYRLLASMGVLTIDTLGLDVERYDPVGPYEDSQTFGVDYPRDDDDDEWMKRY